MHVFFSFFLKTVSHYCGHTTYNLLFRKGDREFRDWPVSAWSAELKGQVLPYLA